MTHLVQATRVLHSNHVWQHMQHIYWKNAKLTVFVGNHKETIMCSVFASLRFAWLSVISLQILQMIKLKGQQREVTGARQWEAIKWVSSPFNNIRTDQQTFSQVFWLQYNLFYIQQSPGPRQLLQCQAMSFKVIVKILIDTIKVASKLSKWP